MTGIAQKKLQSFISIVVPQEKRYIEINKIKITQGKIKSIGNNLDIETKKKVKLYLSYFA